MSERRPNVFVYVITERGGDFAKIGIATDIKRRMKGIQCGNPRRLHVHFTIGFDDVATAAQVERGAHALLRRVRGMGEWFRCDGRAAKAAVMQAANGRGIAPTLTALPPQMIAMEACAL